MNTSILSKVKDNDIKQKILENYYKNSVSNITYKGLFEKRLSISLTRRQKEYRLQTK